MELEIRRSGLQQDAVWISCFISLILGPNRKFLNSYYMKKEYLIPQVRTAYVGFEVNFMTSPFDLGGVGGEDFDDPDDPFNPWS